MTEERVSRRRFLKYAGGAVAIALTGYGIYEATKLRPEPASIAAPTPTTTPSIIHATSTEPLLKAADDLNKVLFVGAHPFNQFERQRANWDDVFGAYHIQFLDRGTALNDVNYIIELDRDTISLAHSLNIYVASYLTQNPGEWGDWSFRHQYYARLPAADRWTDPQGKPQDDPYASSGGRDINGSLIYADGGVRVRMSICSPHWLDYQKRSIEYALGHGIDSIDIDSPQVVPSTLGGTGDFSDWGLKAFNHYLQKHYNDEVLRSWGIEDILGFSFKEYLLRRYISEAIAKKHGDGQPFFNTSPLDKPLGDPIVSAWVKFNYRTLIDFHRELNAHAKEHGQKIGKTYVPYFGNLHLGHPLDQLSCANPSVVLGQVMDIIQIESVPSVPPLRLTTVYKVGLAMGGYRKPVWGLHQPYYGYDYEPKLPLSSKRSYEKLLQLYVAETYAAGAVPEIDLGGWPGVPSPYGLFVTKEGHPLLGLKRYFDFILKHQDVFLGAEPSSQAALVYSIPTFMWHDQPMWGIWYGEQRAAFVGFARAMEEAHIPYDVLIFGHPDVWDDAEALKSLASYRALILPLVDCISDLQLQAIERFVRQGGKLIAAGDLTSLGVRDEDYMSRKQSGLAALSRDQGRGTIKFVAASVLNAYYQNSIVNACFDVLNREKIVSAFRDIRQVLTDAPHDMGINIFKQGSRAVLHLVNYDYDAEADQVVAKDKISFKVRIPEPSRVTSVEVLSPDSEEPKKPSFSADGGYISFVVPELKLWSIVIIA